MRQADALFSTCQASLLAWVRKRLDGRDGSEDIAQEAWLRAAPAIAEGHVENGRAYVFRVAANLIVDHAKAQRRWGQLVVADGVPEQLALGEPSAEDRLIAEERLALLTRIADDLPPRCREVFRLRKSEELSTAEIATRLGISRNMVEKHLRHALLLCAARLAAFEE